MSHTEITQHDGLVTTIVHNGCAISVTVIGVPGVTTPGSGSAPQISADPNNRATLGSDGGVHVRDDLQPDPLAYYILAKG